MNTHDPRPQDPGPNTLGPGTQDPAPRAEDPGLETQDSGPNTQEPRTQDSVPQNLGRWDFELFYWTSKQKPWKVRIHLQVKGHFHAYFYFPIFLSSYGLFLKLS